MKIKELFTGRVWTLSNLLSVSRILLVPVMWLLFSLERSTGQERYTLHLVVLLIVIFLTDFLDGFLARALDQVSRLGQFIDPLADKIATLTLAVLLWYYKGFPIWMVFIMMARDLYAVVGGFILFSRRDIQGRPNLPGKLMVASMGVSALVYILSPSATIAGHTLQEISLLLILLFMGMSSYLYWKTYSKVYFEKKPNN